MKDVSSCDKLRGAAKRALIRRCPNRETFSRSRENLPAEFIGWLKRTQGTETSHVPGGKEIN